MQENIRSFFEGPGKVLAEHLGSGANVLFTIGQTSYNLEIAESRDITVQKDQKDRGDIEISGERETMNDLLSSSSMTEFSQKMKSYIINGKEPAVAILMKRTRENSGKFLRIYYFFLQKMGLLR